MAEGEELGSNLLRVTQRKAKQPSAVGGPGRKSDRSPSSTTQLAAVALIREQRPDQMSANTRAPVAAPMATSTPTPFMQAQHSAQEDEHQTEFEYLAGT